MEMNWIGTQVKFHGIQCMVSRAIDNTHYRLIAMNGTTEQLQKDKSFKEYHEWGAVAVPVYCPSCGKITWYDDTNIPDGEKYEVACECCNTLVMKKKVTNKAGGDTESEADRLISFDALHHADKIISPIDCEVTEFYIDKNGDKYLAGKKSLFPIYQFDAQDYYLYRGNKSVGEKDADYFAQACEKGNNA